MTSTAASSSAADAETGSVLQNAYRVVLNVLGCDYVVVCEDPVARRTIERCYSSFVLPDTHYSTTSKPFLITESVVGWELHFNEHITHCPTLSDLIYDFEKALTLDIQLVRTEWLFVHGAALAIEGRCVVVAGASGAGKSSLCWSLCNAGFQYLSDELAPVDPANNSVVPYPHAICLKSVAHLENALPRSIVHGGSTIHVPAGDIPAPTLRGPVPLAAMIFVDSAPAKTGDELLRTASAGEAAAILYSHCLNQLAHERAGLGAVSQIVSRIPCYKLKRGSPADLVAAVRAALAGKPLAA